MIQVFLSYSRADGLQAATRLRDELAGMGFAIWRDIEEMRGGMAWRKQLFQALSQVDALLVLLTPGAAASANVTWEWQNALIMDKRVIPLLVIPCDAPADLQALHYHHLDDPNSYTLGLARLARDLITIALATRGGAMAEPGDIITTIGSDNAVAARGATVIKQSGGASLDAVAVAQILIALRAQPTDGFSAGQMAELRSILRSLEQQVQGVALGIDDLKAQILARFDVTEQRILAPILARLNDQQVEMTTAILEALEVSPALAEWQPHFAAIEAALAAVQQHTAALSDPQLAQSVAQVLPIVRAEDLDFKHKLKVTLPIVPLLLAYEGEIELNSQLNLKAAWEALKKLAHRSG